MPIQFCPLLGLMLFKGNSRVVFLSEQPLHWLITRSRSCLYGTRDAGSGGCLWELTPCQCNTLVKVNFQVRPMHH